MDQVLNVYRGPLKVSSSTLSSSSSQSCSPEQGDIPYLLCLVETFLVDTYNGIVSFIEAGIQELVNYAPLLVNIPIISVVSSGVAYAFRQAVTDVPLVGDMANLLGRLLTF